ncbi:Gemin2/Brr1 [Trypanosoma melophagium]|uniref:Gemin2/Brr1 n=1 Tax=Trypanosoma melophagium TaxID=715481 RepID=UPI00351A31B4|nr:Gemin2/Brr1 [Trypanosoma melophagium]
MEDDVEAYLKLASRLQRKHFAHGHSSVTQSRSTSGKQDKGLGLATHSVSRLPMKKRKRTDDGDDGHKNGNSSSLLVNSPARTATSTDSLSAANSTLGVPRNPTKMTLMEKWFPGSTLSNATLDAAQAPSFNYIDVSIARMNAARERILSLRAGVEDILRYAHVKDAVDVPNDKKDWCWPELRDVLSQITSQDAFRTKRCVVHAVKWLLTNKPKLDVPNSPNLRLWYNYLSHSGPEQGCEPPLGLLVWLDSACTSALFTVLVSSMLREYKRGIKPKVYSWYDAQEDQSSEKDKDYEEEDDAQTDLERSEEEAKEECEKEKEGKETKDTSLPNLIDRLPPLKHSETSEAIVSLLTFLRLLMPVDIEDNSRNTVNYSTGYGVWIYACLTAVDTPLDPDLDRLVHEFFRDCCRHLRTLCESQNIRGDNRGAIVEALSPRSTDASPCRRYNTIHDVGREDVLALHTIIIVLAKLFRQNQNRLIPL